MARLYQSQGRYDEAESLYLQAMALREKVLGSGHPEMAVDLNDIALLYHEQGRLREAEPLYLRALEIRQQSSQPLEAANVELNLQTLYHSSGRQIDKEHIRELTRILEKAGDRRAHAGRNLLAKLK